MGVAGRSRLVAPGLCCAGRRVVLAGVDSFGDLRGSGEAAVRGARRVFLGSAASSVVGGGRGLQMASVGLVAAPGSGRWGFGFR